MKLSEVIKLLLFSKSSGSQNEKALSQRRHSWVGVIQEGAALFWLSFSDVYEGSSGRLSESLL